MALSTLKKRSGDLGLIYKTYEQPTNVVDSEGEARWAAWIDDRIQSKLETIAEIVGEECGLIERRLREKITALRTDIEVLRQHKASKVDVVPLDRKAAR